MQGIGPHAAQIQLRGLHTDTMKIANKLVALCGQGRNAETLDPLYAGEVTRMEAAVPRGMKRETKGQWWDDNR